MTGAADGNRRTPLPLGLAAVVVWLVWAAVDGGYWPSAWGPLGIALVGVLAAGIAWWPPPVASWSRARVAMLACLALFAAWGFASLLWADFPDDAWAGSNTTLLCLVGLAVFACWPWNSRDARLVLVTYTLGVSAIGVATLARPILGEGAESAFGDGRLLGPVGYVNASVALWTLAFWPASFLASSPRVAPALRALLFAAAGLLLQLAVLGQSRAWLVAAPAAALFALLVARSRLRLLLALLLPAAAAAAAAPWLLDVREAALAGSLGPALDRAAVAVLATAVALAAAGAAWAFADGRLEPSPRRVRQLGVAVTATAATVVLAAGIAGARALDEPNRWLAERWEDFTIGAYPEDERLSGSLGSNRYRHWRIAWAEFREHPVTGNGVDNYYAEYLVRRESADAEPRYPHSWALRLLSEVGLIGAALFVAGASLAVYLALGARRRLSPEDVAPVAGALTVFAYWLLHGAVDWFWEIPALAAPAFGLLGLAGAVGMATSAGPRTRRARAPVIAATGAAAVAVAVSLALPWLSYVYQRAAVAGWRDDPSLAYDRLGRAAALNPLAGDPLLVEGSIALRRDELATARSALERAIDREPRSWYAYFQLALTAGRAGEYERASRLARRARELNPLDPIVAEAVDLIARRQPIVPERLNRRFRDVAEERVAGSG